MSWDLAIPFRPGPKNSVELKYSLRSIEQNLMGIDENSDCYLLGDAAPDWYQGGLVTMPENHKLSNISKVIAKLHNFSRVYGGEEFVYTNDDVFLLKPWAGVRFWNKRATYTPYHGTTVSRAKFVLEQRGLKLVHDYEMHIPIVLKTAQVKSLLDETSYAAPIAFRTLYANTYPESDFGIPDCKIMNFTKPYSSQMFLSTDDAFSHVPDLHKWWGERWPKKSRWEK